jgi:hypothetical protein
VQQAAVEREGDHHRECAADQRPQAAEEDGVAPADVVSSVNFPALMRWITLDGAECLPPVRRPAPPTKGEPDGPKTAITNATEAMPAK